ncbi:MAG: HTH domain-containing protein, partial [Proteobacteria bacterium]|nr:HTH domain-containing protein [Pseudomonadota bacterium]
QKNILEVSADAMEIFLGYHWPGNVRELRNAIEYASVLCTQGWIEPKHIPPKIRKGDQRFKEKILPSPADPPDRNKLLALLRQTRGNQSQLARTLGISRVTLWKRIKKLGIRIPEDI